MSTGRRLVRRSANTSKNSPAQGSRHLESESSRRTSSSLPPYEPLICPISADSQRKLQELYLHHDYSKYKKNIRDATNIITKAAYECNDRLWQRKQKLQALEEKLKASEGPISKKIQAKYDNDKNYVGDLEKTVGDVTSQAEQAVRELIDYGDEITIHPRLMQELSDNCSSPSVVQGGNGCVEIFKAAKQNYLDQYNKKSMNERYADHNDYKNFKGMVHDAQNQGPNARPLPNPKYWFPSENTSQTGQHVTQENHESDEDDEIVMTGATRSLKCSFTLQYFEEPYSNKKCKHTYEKSAILDYLGSEGTAYSQPSGINGYGKGPKIVICPTPGCNAYLGADDFFLDERVRQQVIQAKKFEATAASADDSDDESPRRTQRTRPDVLDDEDDDPNTFVVEGDK